MILCKYVKDDGIDIIKKLRIKASDPNAFNDPFELSLAVGEFKSKLLKRAIDNPQWVDGVLERQAQLGRHVDKKKVLQNIDNLHKNPILLKEKSEDLREKTVKHIKEFKEVFSRFFRIICFSDSSKVSFHEEILLWSHYAQGHKGIRIWVETDDICCDGLLRSVKCSDKRYAVNWDAFDDKYSRMLEDYTECIFCKSIAWEYEKEHRLLVKVQECVEEEGNKYVKISPKAIRRVDFGVDCPQNMKKDVIHALNEVKCSHVEKKEADIDPVEFKMQYKTLD